MNFVYDLNTGIIKRFSNQELTYDQLTEGYVSLDIDVSEEVEPSSLKYDGFTIVEADVYETDLFLANVGIKVSNLIHVDNKEYELRGKNKSIIECDIKSVNNSNFIEVVFLGRLKRGDNSSIVSLYDKTNNVFLHDSINVTSNDFFEYSKLFEIDPNSTYDIYHESSSSKNQINIKRIKIFELV
jgi:hypothetical protein